MAKYVVVVPKSPNFVFRAMLMSTEISKRYYASHFIFLLLQFFRGCLFPFTGAFFDCCLGQDLFFTGVILS